MTSTPAISRSASHDFDFLHGAWHVTHDRLRSRLCGADDWYGFAGRMTCWPVLDGLGNVDDNRLEDPDGSYAALSTRSFSTASGRWAIWWLDARSPHRLDPPVVGGFVDGVGTFEAADTFAGRPVVVRFVWTGTDGAQPRWEQSFSADGGTTWEVNWRMSFSRMDSPT